ncbi:Olfactory receptor 2AJ1, partial [Galemys pyrenaicus]
MEAGNETVSTDFILLGLFPGLIHADILVSVILLIYTIAITGNTTLILLICADPHLHTSMYFLLTQLSLIDLAFISSIVPKMAFNFFSGKKKISLIGCGTQIFFTLALGIAECLLLTLMAYDRYVAICHPLRYPIIISHQVSQQMAIGCWVGGALVSLAHTAYSMHFPLCGPRELRHFFCEVKAILKLSCEDISAYEKGVVVTSIVVVLVPISLILTSYSLIFMQVLRINSSEGRKKAMATCSSHLTVVIFYYGPAILIYMRPGSSQTPILNQALFMFDTILTPMMNPLIYSLRNRDVVSSMKKDPWLGWGALVSLAHTAYSMHFPLCGPRELRHFFCEVKAILKLSCEDICLRERSGSACPQKPHSDNPHPHFMQVLRINSSEGRKKAMATCSFHLTVVIFYHGPATLIYMIPGSSQTPILNQALLLSDTILTPILRNRDVVSSMKKGPWLGWGALVSLAPTAYSMHFPLCGPRELRHFFCEVKAILKLSCEDISVYEKGVVVTSVLVVLVPRSLILTSHSLIFPQVMRINSSEGRKKAMATCSFHLTVVIFNHGPAMLILRNRDVVSSVKKVLWRCPLSNCVEKYARRHRSGKEQTCQPPSFPADGHRVPGGGWGALVSLAPTAHSMHFPLCGPRELRHFFCEVKAILKLSCEDISVYKKEVIVTRVLVVLVPRSLILTSHSLIFLQVLRINSSEGRKKAMATCSSHLTVVIFNHGPAML